MDAQYTLRYRELYEKHWWWRAREQLILSTLKKIRPVENWGPILDIGCGDGLFFDRLSKLGDVEGIEMDSSLVSPIGRWRNRIHMRPFDGAFEPGKQYSLILMLDVLEHFVHPLACLRRALELLEPQGTLLVTVPAFRCLWTSHDELNHHFTRYTKQSFARLACEAGMRIHDSRYFFLWTCPVKLAIRLKEKIFPGITGPPKIPSHWINETLYMLSKLEHEIFGALPMPFGSSLIVIGGKQ